MKKTIMKARENDMKRSSTIAYKGELTLKVMHGNKVVKTIKQHNEGTTLLMDFLVRCLGSQYDSELAPRYIRAFHTDEKGMQTDKECTIRPIATNFSPSYIEKYTDKEEKALIKKGVVLTFLIPYSALDSNNPTLNRFALYGAKDYSGDKNNYLAWIKSEDIPMVPGESLMILWEMTLENIG